MEKKKTRTKKQSQQLLGLPASHEITTLEQENMPMIPLRGLVVFPGLSLTFDVARDRSRAAVKAAMASDQLVFLAAQMNLATDWPSEDDIYKIGCVARIRQVFEANNTDSVKLLVEGLHRARRLQVISDDPYYQVDCTRYSLPESADNLPLEAYRRQLMRQFEKFASASSRISAEALLALNSITDPSLTADTIVSHLNIQLGEKQRLLEIFDIPLRVGKLIEILSREQSIAELEREIGEKVRSTIEKNQKEYYLREQIKIIQTELGENEGSQDEQDRYLDLMSQTAIPSEYRAKVTKEIGRLARMQQGNPEGSVLRNYLDLLFEMPWGKIDAEHLDIPNARKVLDKDHYG